MKKKKLDADKAVDRLSSLPIKQDNIDLLIQVNIDSEPFKFSKPSMYLRFSIFETLQMSPVLAQLKIYRVTFLKSRYPFPFFVNAS